MLGAGIHLDRIEETVDTTFTAEGFFPAFDPEVLRPHMPWLAPRYFIATVPAKTTLLFSSFTKAGLWLHLCVSLQVIGPG